MRKGRSAWSKGRLQGQKQTPGADSATVAHQPIQGISAWSAMKEAG